MKQLASHLYRSLWYIKKDLPNNSVKNLPAMQETWRPGFYPLLGSSPGEGKGYPFQYSWASLVAQLVKNLPTMRETWVRSLDREDPLENRKATHSSTLTYRIPWTIQSMWSQRVGHDCMTFTSLSHNRRG